MAASLAPEFCVDVAGLGHLGTERGARFIQRFQQAAVFHERVGLLGLSLARRIL